MPKPPAITDAEWPVMKVLWDHPGAWLGAADVVEPVAAERGVHHRTVRTLLARLVKKGAVETRPDPAASYLSRAKVTHDAVARAEPRTSLPRVFDGTAAPALVPLLSEPRDRLSTEQIQELRD